jgi:TolB-like protein
MADHSPKALLVAAFLACALAAHAISLPVTAQTPQAVVAPIENRAGLTADEISVLTNSVRSALAGGAGELEIIPAETVPGATCDAACASARAKEIGARYLITGAVSTFGGQFTVQVEALDRTSGAIAASASTPPTPALVDLMPLVGSAATALRTALTAKIAAKSAPASPHPAPQTGAGWRPRPASRPADDGATAQFGNTGLLVVTSEPSGADVYLGHSMVYAGVTPIQKHLPPGGTRVTLHLDGYFDIDKKPARIFTGEATRLNYVLRQRSPLYTAGAALTGSGLAMALFGSIIAGVKDDDPDVEARLHPSGIVLLSLGAAMTLTGVALLIVDGTKHKKKERKPRGLTMAPTSYGVAMAYRATF